MKRNRNLILIVVALLILAGTIGVSAFPFGRPFFNGNGFRSDQSIRGGWNYGPGMMGGWSHGPGRRGNLNYGSGMMGYGRYGYNQQLTGEKMSVEEVEDAVNVYLGSFNDFLEISDIFIYVDSDYYVSIKEKETGKGAMELLINPYTGDIYPEYGPNMMWNKKYGMHRNLWYSKSRVSRDIALEYANQYVQSFIRPDYIVENEGHEFYGYYTFHVNKGGQTVGMLSVNDETGDVWYHTWHGELDEIISHHDDE